MRERGTRRIWSELYSAPALIQSGALRALAQRRIDLLFAVGPDQFDDARAVIEACRHAGVGVGLWPLLDPERGRWANELTAHAIAPFAEELFEKLERESLLPDELAIDLEPPFDLLAERTLRSLGRFAIGNRHEGKERLLGWRAHARARGIRVVAAVLPTVLADGPRRRWQRLLATPVDSLDADHVTVMLYTSLIEGYTRGQLGRADVRALLAEVARQASTRTGFGLSLGAIATGSLGDEPTYRTPAELADDVAIARGLGIEELALFSLCGALRRPPIEAWLDAFVLTEPGPAPTLTARARLVWGAIQLIGR